MYGHSRAPVHEKLAVGKLKTGSPGLGGPSPVPTEGQRSGMGSIAPLPIAAMRG